MARCRMLPPTQSPWLVPFDGKFDASRAPTEPDDAPGKKKLEARLRKVLDELFEEQRKLMAQDRHALLVVIQALDAGGKDGTIRAITRGLDSTGCRVISFKAPSSEELDHDFLRRVHRVAPERGTIGIFNRSHYEEVLIVRVQPELLAAQRLPDGKAGKALWECRYRSIREFEAHLARSGTTIRKFWLNVSKEEQRRRFIDRIEERQSRWKFSASDLDKRRQRPEYLEAYSEALAETSRPEAPWYAVPADDKPYMRLTIAEILLDTLKSMKLTWPKPSKEDLAEMRRVKAELQADE